jgi:hypothetical protein
MAKEDIGVSVDWELKALLVITVYAFMKLVGDFSKHPTFILVARAFFVIGHLLFFYFFMLTNGRITKAPGRPSEDKTKAKKACQLAFRNILARAVVIGFIHYRTHMMPPLIISVFMAFFTLVENIDYYYVIHSKFPRIFELFF